MNKGNYSDHRLPKFFKIYLPGESEDDLEIPVSFNGCLPDSKPGNVTVRSIYGNVWKLELKKRCGEIEKFVMVDGWKRIVKNEDLTGGEFLAFEFDGYGIFNFCIYGSATCKRLGNSVKTKEMEEDASDGEDDKSSDGITVIDDDDDDDDGDDEALDVDDDVECDDNDDELRKYLDDRDDPFFTAIINPKRLSQLLIPTRVVKDYDLSFPEVISIVDPLTAKFGTLEKKIKVQDNGSVYIQGFGSVFRRNNVKTTDTMICEFKKSGNGLAHTMKIYVVRGMIFP
ncbi:unnamed protein product [Thlaspi arvense]|uniref:TF-B3 domain-containing protein n=1 Tax=Thlaspi arvense TaxID=13288 RepID=A0AAU9SU32_THLAR|nr:unnamed protein product [Thlaspi arvense]